MRVLGIDPGTVRMGYGVIDDIDGVPRFIVCGVLKASPRSTLGARLKALYDSLREVILTHKPDEIAIESPFVARNVRSAMAIGEARAIATLLAAQSGVSFTQYSPAQIKSVVANYGAGDKLQVQEGVKLLLGLSTAPGTFDASDALAVAICHHRHRRLKGLAP